MTTGKLIASIEVAIAALGPDASLKHLSALLHLHQAGRDGIEAGTLTERVGATQAAGSRTLTKLRREAGLAEHFLHDADGRLRLNRLTPQGQRVVASMLASLK